MTDEQPPSTEAAETPAASGAEVPDAPLLVFVHIRKTAGYSLRKILLQQYGGRSHVRLLDNYFTRPSTSADLVREIAANPPAELHVAHGHILLWPDIEWPARTRLITILRNPVERTISHYYWLRERNPHLTMSLDEALEAGEIHDNLQTRVLSASEAPVGEMADDALSRAIASLDRFMLVGLTERFDESVALLTREFGWHRMLYERANITPGRKPREAIAPETLDRIEQHNALDIELYGVAAKRFDELIERQSEEFGLEVAALRAANTRFGRLGEDGNPENLGPSIAPQDPADGDGLDLRELVIESQAELLLREELRLSKTAMARRLEKELGATTRQLQTLKRQAELAGKKVTQQDATVTRLQVRLQQRAATTKKLEEQIERMNTRIRDIRQGQAAEIAALKDQQAKKVARLEQKVTRLLLDRTQRPKPRKDSPRPR